MIDQSLRDRLMNVYLASIPLITLNILWVIVSLPLVTAIPAAAALFYATNQLAHGKPADWRTFFEGFRLYWRRCWVWGILNVIVAVVFASNIVFYSVQEASWTMWARTVVVCFAFLWLATQIYTFPLLLEQKQPDLRLALRNSLVIVVKRPLFTVSVTLLVVILVVGSTLVIQPMWIFITGSLCAFLANLATVSSIAAITGTKAAQE